MMKHPKHRVSDVLLWDAAARDDVYNHMRGVVDEHLPAFIKDLLHEIQQVGSMTWGGATLRSDADFNLCLVKDVSWMDYCKARRWYYSTSRGQFQRAVDAYWLQWGLKIDCGMMDVETDAYNTYVSLKDMKLYHRTTDLMDDWKPNDVGEYPSQLDPSPIDLLTFDPDKDPIPPAKSQHLVWDGYKLRWRRESADRPWKRNAKWSEDKWAHEAHTWKAKYKLHYQDYKRDGVELIPI